MVDVGTRPLVQPGPAAVGDGLVERLESLQGIGLVLGRLAEVVVESLVGRPPRLGTPVALLLGEVLADQGVGV